MCIRDSSLPGGSPGSLPSPRRHRGPSISLSSARRPSACPPARSSCTPGAAAAAGPGNTSRRSLLHSPQQ
eukprot:3876008-Alexandrium_andersonii.AAC.1